MFDCLGAFHVTADSIVRSLPFHPSQRGSDQPIWAQAPQPALPPELRQLRDTLIAHSAQAAIGYRLGLREGLPEMLWFPSTSGRRSKRFDGRFDDRPYFELRPCFEPPRVPRATLYEVEFVGADLFVFKLPYALSGGIYVPVATPMCLPGKKHIPRRRPRPSL